MLCRYLSTALHVPKVSGEGTCGGEEQRAMLINNGSCNGFPLLWGCTESAAGRQCEPPSLFLGCEMLCCSCRRELSLSSCSRCEEWGGQPRAHFWCPQEHSWARVRTDTACLLLKSQKKWVLVSQAVVCAQIFHVNFLFSGKLMSSFFFNIIEFSKCKIIFWFSRQICCYLSRLSDIAGAFNKCLLLLMEIKLLGVSLARGIKN